MKLVRLGRLKTWCYDPMSQIYGMEPEGNRSHAVEKLARFRGMR